MIKYLWEVLVPYGDGKKKFPLSYHQKWDEKVKCVSSGLTIIGVQKGKWVSKTGSTYNEKMIAVRIAATDKEIEEIVDFTLDHYNQKAVFYYKVSEEVYIKFK